MSVISKLLPMLSLCCVHREAAGAFCRASVLIETLNITLSESPFKGREMGNCGKMVKQQNWARRHHWMKAN
jgi:hypothetical protein